MSFTRGGELTDWAVWRLAEKCLSLGRVNLDRFYEFADKAGKHLAEKCLSLQSVSFRRRDELASTSRKSAGACRA